MMEIFNSETMRDIKKSEKIYPNWNIFFAIWDYLKFFVAAKLSAPCILVFWAQNDRNSLNFEATKKFKKYQVTKKLF